MAQTENGFYYPDDYTKVADVPGDLKKLAESIDVEVGNIKSNQSTNSKDIEQLKKINETQNKNIEQISEDVEEIKEEQRTQNANIEKLQKNQEKLQTEVQELNEDIKANAIIEETEKSKSLYIDDANASRGKVNVFGNMEQEIREGYNIYDYLPRIKASQGGLTTTKDEKTGYITINGTPTSDYVTVTNELDITDLLEDGQTYTLWQEKHKDSNTYGVYMQVTETTPDNTNNFYFSRDENKTFVVNKANTYKINIQTGSITNTKTLSNYKNRYMLYKGTGNKEFELYGASPSFDYRSEIKCLQEEVEIKHTNKNIIDLLAQTLKINGWHMSESYNETDTKVLKLPYNKNAIWDTFYFSLDERYVGKNISLSFDIKVKNLKYLNPERFCLQNSNEYSKSVIKNMYSSSLKEDTYTRITVEGYNLKNSTIAFFAGIKYNSEDPNTDSMYVYIKNFQIELGEQVTECTEHQEESYQLDIQQDMVSSEDDYFDLERKKEVHGWEKIIFDGTENITKALDNIYNYTLIKKAKAILNNNTSHKSNKYKSVVCTGSNDAFVIAATSDYAINLNSGDGMRLRIKDIRNLSANDFKASLAQQHESGEPTIVYYKLETPIELDLTDTQIQQLEKLNKLRFYEGVNNIMTLEDIALIQAQYSVNIQTKLNNINNQLLSLGGN